MRFMNNFGSLASDLLARVVLNNASIHYRAQLREANVKTLALA